MVLKVQNFVETRKINYCKGSSSSNSILLKEHIFVTQLTFVMSYEKNDETHFGGGTNNVKENFWAVLFSNLKGFSHQGKLLIEALRWV